MGDTKDKMKIKKAASILLWTKEIKQSTMFYLKAKIYTPEDSSPQEANINLLKEK